MHLQIALVDMPQKEARMDFFGQQARQNFNAHAVMDVQLRFRFLLDDAAGQRGDFARFDGVDDAQLDAVDIVGRQGLGKLLQTVFVLQQGFSLGQQHFAGAGELHAVVGAHKQGRAHIAFERFDLGGHGRLGEEQFFGSLREVFGAGNGDKGF